MRIASEDATTGKARTVCNVINVISMNLAHPEVCVLVSGTRNAAVLVPGENLPTDLTNLKTR